MSQIIYPSSLISTSNYIRMSSDYDSASIVGMLSSLSDYDYIFSDKSDGSQQSCIVGFDSFELPLNKNGLIEARMRSGGSWGPSYAVVTVLIAGESIVSVSTPTEYTSSFETYSAEIPASKLALIKNISDLSVSISVMKLYDSQFQPAHQFQTDCSWVRLTLPDPSKFVMSNNLGLGVCL